MAEGLEQLPTWLQTTVASAFAVGAAVAAFKGWTKKKLESLASDEHHSANTVMISGALADGAAIRDLTSAIRELVNISTRNHDLMDRMCVGQDRVDATLNRLGDDVRRIREDRRN